MEILRGYGLGPKLQRQLRRFFDEHVVISKSGGTTKRVRGVKMYRVSGSYLEALHIHNEKLTMLLNNPSRYTA